MECKLNTMAPNQGATRPRKRVGRGHGSGTHKTSGKGTKGQRARTGHHGLPRPGFEGGQTPMARRLPKRGFHNPFRVEYSTVNMGQILEKLHGMLEINIEILKKQGLVPRSAARVKVLGELFSQQNIPRGLKISAHRFSGAAQSLLELHEGQAILIES